MPKKSQKRPMRYEKDQLGCMWGLMSMFDFRNGRSTQKLLADKRRGTRHAAGPGRPRNKIDKLTSSNENCQGTIDCEDKDAAPGNFKPSVKKLIEEEMFSEHDAKKELTNIEVILKQPDSEYEGHKRKNRRRGKRSRKKSCDNIHDINKNENLGSECYQYSRHQTMNSLDIDNMMEEFCHQIHQKSIDCMKHDQPGEVHSRLNHNNREFKEKFTEIIKFLISQRLIDGKYPSQDGEIFSSKDFAEALQILGSDEELFLRLLQDPDSLLSKDLQDLQNAQAEKEENLKPVVDHNFPEKELGDVSKSDVLASRKQHNFFRRKAKSQHGNLLNENKPSQTSNRIVILKPGPKTFLNSEAGDIVGSSPQSHYIVREKEQSERVGSHFFLSEIKRKLKYAIGKEQQRISSDGVSTRFSAEHQNSGDSDKGTKEKVRRNSPSKEHFFIEKMAKPSIWMKKGDRNKLKDYEIGREHESGSPNQGVSNIYLEAKKHLSEMLSNGDDDVDISSKKIPKTLGRILSLPEYNTTPIGSPGTDWEHNFVTAQKRFSISERFQKVNENEQENHVSLSGQTTENPEAQRPSPVSVLEPLFTEDDISPANTRLHSVEKLMQPLRIQFEENDSPATDQGNHVTTFMDDKRSLFEHVRGVLETAGMNWEEIYIKSLSSEQLLEPSLCDEVEFFPNQLCYDQKLLFDCINEVIAEVCGNQCGCSPWVSFVKPKFQPLPKMENIICEVQERVYLHVLPMPLPRTLEQIVRKDMAKAGIWMDLRFDTDCIGIEMGEMILDELIEETIFSSFNASVESEHSALLAVSKENGQD
ncbi:uncharacterized protein LOC110820985 [Carica papaya]|uniref:uncharacterized protein LOC110820985 n=1 Tax=Carica papaya TaxID=3649 RepID=UPI000B8CF75B|nr:uncharacterized protein LOC110820985 [Carica papaya]